VTPVLGDRVDRARWVTVDRIAPRMFEARSFASDDVHRCDVELGSCTCPDFEFGVGEEGGWCKHLLAVALQHPEILFLSDSV
jgi:hypothetical protein